MNKFRISITVKYEDFKDLRGPNEKEHQINMMLRKMDLIFDTSKTNFNKGEFPLKKIVHSDLGFSEARYLEETKREHLPRGLYNKDGMVYFQPQAGNISGLKGHMPKMELIKSMCIPCDTTLIIE